MNTVRIHLIVFLLFLQCGCSSTLVLRRSKSDNFTTNASTRSGAVFGADRLEVDANFLKSFGAELKVVAEEARTLQRTLSSRGPQGLLDQDLERVEYMLFRHQICRSGLWEIADHYNSSGTRFKIGKQKITAQLIGLNAAMQLAYYDTLFTLTFYEDENSRGALNRPYPMSEIPAGTYNAIMETSIDPQNLDARDAAWFFFTNDKDIAEAAAKDPTIAWLADEIRMFHEFSEMATTRLLDKRGVVFPTLENRLRQSSAAGLIKATTDAGLKGVNVLGRLSMTAIKPLYKSPLIRGTKFTEEQMDLIKTLIEPGDIFLTHSPAYLSSLIFPGVFKHGIAYVGTAEQRQVIGIQRRWKYSKKSDNLIEAVGPGVGFNDLTHIVDDSIGKIAVLRPKIGIEERKAYLQGVYDFLGRPYDLRFDFMDRSRLCCTEVIYHTLNNMGSIKFPMKQRIGRPTLSADDILLYYLKEPGVAFDLVLLAEPEPGKLGNNGVVHFGAEATERLKELLKVD